MAPDIYAGKNGDEIRPRWVADVEKEGKTEIDGCIELDPSTFPPGTKILIQVPLCPTCQLDADCSNGGGICDCGFDWNRWTEEQYG